MSRVSPVAALIAWAVFLVIVLLAYELCKWRVGRPTDASPVVEEETEPAAMQYKYRVGQVVTLFDGSPALIDRVVGEECGDARVKIVYWVVPSGSLGQGYSYRIPNVESRPTYPFYESEICGLYEEKRSDTRAGEELHERVGMPELRK